jgi:hypothetical protein
MIPAAYLFKQLKEEASEQEKKNLYEALSRLAFNIEELDQKIRHIEQRVSQIPVR